MAKWNETKEPYVKVIESVKETVLNPAAGGDLIIGGVVRTNAGPLSPNLVTSRSQLLEEYTTDGVLTADDDITLLNAYRLVGSAKMLLCRASGLNGAIYTRELKESDLNEYLYKQNQILKKVTGANISIKDLNTPWKVEVTNIGTIGKDTTADIYVATLSALVEQLNETDVFHIPYESYSVSEDGKTLSFSDIYAGSNPLVIPGDDSNVSIELNNEFHIENYILNTNSTAGTLDVTVTKSKSDDGLDRVIYRIEIDNSGDIQTFIIGSDKEEGEITLEDFNKLYDAVQIVCPKGFDSIAFPTSSSGETSIHIDLKIPSISNLLKISERDYQKSWDLIQTDERYVVEGFCDLGEADTAHQNYISAAARSLNAFYPISPNRSVNYMVIANHFSKITSGTNDMVLYQLAPWDEDDGTLGFKFDCSPAVMYWEAVMRNKANNNEFAAVLGEIRGTVSPVSLTTEFNRKERQLLLTRKVNTIFNDISLNSIYINDNVTKQANENIMSCENNVRLKIRISRAMPILLSQFRGRQSNIKTWNEVESVISYWFKTNIMTMNYTVADFRVKCDDTNNPVEVQRANKLNVLVQCRYYGTVKYITVKYSRVMQKCISYKYVNCWKHLLI